MSKARTQELLLLNLFTGNNTWNGTQTFRKIQETQVDANSTAAYTVDTALGTIFNMILNANCTFTFAAAAASTQFTLRLKQDATGGRVVTWPSNVRWQNDVTPTITTTANKSDTVSFISDGTYWEGYIGGQNYNRN